MAMDAAQTLRFVMDELWEHEAESERTSGARVVYCGRCEEAGGSIKFDANWTDVPHSDDCAYAKAAVALGVPRVVCSIEEDGK